MNRNILGQFTSEGVKGSNNAKWKGDKVGYFGLHSWVYRNLGKATICEVCGNTKNIQWANKSHLYKRDIKDWLSLCIVCHRKHDGHTKLSKETAILIKQRIQLGEKQTHLAKEYKVDQSTISNIWRGKIQYYA